MDTYQYRDSRREKIAAALALLPAGEADLRSILLAEEAALQTADWTVTDDTFEAVAIDWILQNAGTIKAAVDQDPLLKAMGVTSLLTPAQADAIKATSLEFPSTPPPNYLSGILVAVDQDPAVFSELLHAAHQDWLKEGVEKAVYPRDDVGVLLPLRLETLFDAPGSKHNDDVNNWKLSIRVIPDEASICRDDEFVSSDEVEVLQVFWHTIKQEGKIAASWMDGEAAGIAWEQLSARIRPERAAWLIANLAVDFTGSLPAIVLPEGMPEQPTPNRVGGMPPELMIYAVTTTDINGTDHHLVGRLPKDKEAFIDSDALLLELPSSSAQSKETWWSSWEKAKAAGVGDEFILPNGVTPQNMEALYVVGIGDESPEAHFKSQVNAGELGISRLGGATNSVKGADTGERVNWKDVTRARLEAKFKTDLYQMPKLHRFDKDVSTPLSRKSKSFVVKRNTAGSKVQHYLTGKTGVLPFFPGADVADDTVDSQQFVKALWPALWGQWLHDVWNTGNAAFSRGLWAFDHLCPEGPLMPLRIGDQPYGLLPVTSLELWEAPAAFDEQTALQLAEEKVMVSRLHVLCQEWANASREKRSVVGKTSAEFMQLLAQEANSSSYIQRAFFPVSYQLPMYGLDDETKGKFIEQAMRAYEPAFAIMGTKMEDPYLANGNPKRLTLPLVQSTKSLFRYQQRGERIPLALQEFFSSFIDFHSQNGNYELEPFFKSPHKVTDGGEYWFGSLPDSLLIRLLLNALQIAMQWQDKNPGNVLLEQLQKEHQNQTLRVALRIDQEKWRIKQEDSVDGKSQFSSLIPEDDLKRLERAFCATLDTAANRIDPWVTGIAWQRLKVNSNSAQHHHRLGAYGWVDGPFMGEPGPTESGLLHTPSYNQTLAALIMRDKYLSSKRTGQINDSGQNSWEMNITSQKVRLTEEIAEEVRMGFHIYEVIGRQVEHIVSHPIKVRALRASPEYAMRDERRDTNEVCDGVKALNGLLKGDVNFPMDAEQFKALKLLKDSLDTYSDLLMSDGVMQIVNRQTDRAAETMDAAAGTSRPPTFEFIRTPPSGYQLETVVLSALPFVSIGSIGGNIHPIRLADPSVAAHVENTLGSNWTWTAVNEDDGAVIGTVTLAAINLSPVDTLSISDELIRELVRYKLNLPLVYITKSGNRQWEALDTAGNFLNRSTLVTLMLDPDNLPEHEILNEIIRTKLGVPDDAVLKETVPDHLNLWVAKDERGSLLGLVDKFDPGVLPEEEAQLHKAIRQFLNLPKVRIDAAREHQLAQQLVASLGNRPAAGPDLTDDKTASGLKDTSSYGELVSRYTHLFNACQHLLSKINKSSNDEERSAALREALPWGMVPAAEPADREALMAVLLGLPLPELATPLETLIGHVSTSLLERLKKAVDPADLASEESMAAPLANHKARKQQDKPDGVSSLARSIANLAAPNARLAILACWNKEVLIGNTKLITGAAENIEEEWLTVMASVRASLARLEALQLEVAAPMVSWTNSPGDPWRSGKGHLVQQNLEIRELESVVNMQMQRFVAVYGTAATWQGEQVAVGLIDAFSEAIPMPQRKTMAAFGFNAPSARAPQAILLAVPPKPRQRLTTEVLLKILEETRMLAHARTARMEDLGSFQSLSPSMWLQASGPARVRLENAPLFTD